MNLEIIEKLKNIPSNPGVYLWKDKNNRIIYVGKAINLKKRMNQYFKGSINSYKTTKLVEEIANFDYIICNNNKEALILEKNLIEKYNPEYNILLLDDRGYPYIKLKLTNKLEITFTKKINHYKNENEIYYGPFPDNYGASTILKLLQRESFYKDGLPIINVDQNYWKEQFERIKNILSFKNSLYLNELKNKMLKAAEYEQFELALEYKKNIEYLNKMKENQIVELQNQKNIDAFIYKIIDDKIHILFSFYRWGILINQDYQTIEIHIDWKDSLLDFLNLYYKNKIIPDLLLIPNEINNLEINFIKNSKIVSPKIGTNKKILDNTLTNLIASIEKNKFKKDKNENLIILNEIKEYLNLPKVNKIIIFDNSNFGNQNCVGVAITYLNGIKAKNLYKKFNHELTMGYRKSDVEYMNESISRFFKHEENLDYDLIIVDGGIAQIHEAKKVLKTLNLQIPVIGLSKDNNHKTKNFIDLNEKINLIQDKKWLNFLSEIQIEVDRFAKSHFRNKHKISSLEGTLTKIKGLGKETEKLLLEVFKTYSAIYNASEEELSKYVSKNLAKKIKEFNK